MAEKFLLPCPCGRTVVVEPRLAGQMVPCQCGTPLEVPTLLAMTKLPRLPPAEAVEEDAKPSAPWGVSQNVHFIGWLVLIAGVSIAAYALWARPASPVSTIDLARTRLGLDAWAEKTTPVASFELWRQIQAMGLYGIPPKAEKDYADALFPYQVSLVIAVLMMLLGLGLIVGSYVGRRWSDPANDRSRLAASP